MPFARSAARARSASVDFLLAFVVDVDGVGGARFATAGLAVTAEVEAVEGGIVALDTSAE